MTTTEVRKKHRGGRHLGVAAQLADKYGVPRRRILSIGVERFERMNEDARRVMLNELGRTALLGQMAKASRLALKHKPRKYHYSSADWAQRERIA